MIGGAYAIRRLSCRLKSRAHDRDKSCVDEIATCDLTRATELFEESHRPARQGHSPLKSGSESWLELKYAAEFLEQFNVAI
jgi:hypothetical protein